MDGDSDIIQTESVIGNKAQLDKRMFKYISHYLGYF